MFYCVNEGYGDWLVFMKLRPMSKDDRMQVTFFSKSQAAGIKMKGTVNELLYSDIIEHNCIQG